VNVLLTSVGRRVELAQAFKQAYRTLGLSGSVVATDLNPLSPALQVVDCPYIVPPIASDEYLPALVEICQREHIHLVFPLVDPDIPRLSHARTQLEATGAKLAVVPPAAAEITRDKWQTFQFFMQHGIPVARAWLPPDVPPEAEFPLFIKPRAGSASQDTFKIHNQDELNFFSQYIRQPIVQEFLPGPEITSDVLCDMQGQVLSVVSRRRLEVRGGEVVKGVTIYDEAITQYCIRIARQLQAVGPITVQCMLRDGQPFFTEVNARFGGGFPLALAAGVDAPKILLAQQAGLPIEIPSPGQYTIGLYVSRFDNAFFIDESRHHDMALRRL
jgi:carbamoyl-phosphate synthase large subunit